MRRIFTKSFFRLTGSDQAKVLSAVLADITNQRYASKADEAKARRKAKRIEEKAVEYGVWADEGQP